MQVRTLRASEREALLELLDGWQLADGWRGRDFFRRYVEDDPSFRDENVFVAEDAGRLVSCVQIFPRRVRIGSHAVPLGGVGSVFTRPEARERGVASRLLEAAVSAMRARGMELSLLFAARLHFYARLGWHSWGSRAAYRRTRPEASPRRAEIAPLCATRELEAVAALHANYSGKLEGTAVRGTADWSASLILSGNPKEEFLVARRGGLPVAYLRATRLYGVLQILEFGRRPDAADALAELLGRVMTPRDPDPFAPLGKTSEEFRSVATGLFVVDAGLREALSSQGLAAQRKDDPGTMLRCLDAPALARRLGLPPPSEANAGEGLLQRVLPRERFHFWPADRF